MKRVPAIVIACVAASAGAQAEGANAARACPQPDQGHLSLLQHLRADLPLAEMGRAWLQGGIDGLVREAGTALLGGATAALTTLWPDQAFATWPIRASADPSATSIQAAFRMRLGEASLGARLGAGCQFGALEGACTAGYSVTGNDWDAFARGPVKWLIGAGPQMAEPNRLFEFSFSFKTASAPGTTIASLLADAD